MHLGKVDNWKFHSGMRIQEKDCEIFFKRYECYICTIWFKNAFEKSCQTSFGIEATFQFSRHKLKIKTISLLVSGSCFAAFCTNCVKVHSVAFSTIFKETFRIFQVNQVNSWYINLTIEYYLEPFCDIKYVLTVTQISKI